MTKMINCEVSLGTFSNERGIAITLPGRTISAIVDKRDVRVTEDPKPGGRVSGQCRVSVVQVGKREAIIDLPRPTLTEGARIKVPKEFLR